MLDSSHQNIRVKDEIKDGKVTKRKSIKIKTKNIIKNQGAIELNSSQNISFSESKDKDQEHLTTQNKLDCSVPEKRLKGALLGIKFKSLKKTQTSGKTYHTGDTTDGLNSDKSTRLK